MGITKEGSTSCMITIRQTKIYSNLNIVKIVSSRAKTRKKLKVTFKIDKRESLRSRAYRIKCMHAFFLLLLKYRITMIKKALKLSVRERII